MLSVCAYGSRALILFSITSTSLPFDPGKSCLRLIFSRLSTLTLSLPSESRNQLHLWEWELSVPQSMSSWLPLSITTCPASQLPPPRRNIFLLFQILSQTLTRTLISIALRQRVPLLLFYIPYLIVVLPATLGGATRYWLKRKREGVSKCHGISTH